MGMKLSAFYLDASLCLKLGFRPVTNTALTNELMNF
jgi:hypothetical protein